MAKKNVVEVCVVAAVLLIGGIVGRALSFEAGDVSLSWQEDTLVLSISFAAEPPAETAMLVITVKADRFVDGVYAWQLHFGPAHRSIVAIPNDFLTVQLFAMADLGVTAVWSDACTCDVCVPCDGVISKLVAEGDSVEIHALWLQQAPIVAFHVPPQTENVQEQEDVTATAGGGGEAESTPGDIFSKRETEQSDSGEDTQECAEPEQPGTEIETDPPTTSLFPDRDTFTLGEVLRHSFAVIGDDGSPLLWVPLSLSVMRDLGNEMMEFIQYQYIVCDDVNELYTYEIDTAAVGLGEYILMIGSPCSSYNCDMLIRIIPAESEKGSS